MERWQGNLLVFHFLSEWGWDELSMNVHAIPKVKKLLNCITFKDSKEIVKNVLKLKTAQDVREFVVSSIMEKWGESLPDECISENTM
ncbi:MAG: hypothetical protein KatS3mg078_2398 [Deltaproteobacteria bacterium]|nr:MAG: hypothetical protein KatS3mg078_2398 [Deltaproteobacteria bacterium]